MYGSEESEEPAVSRRRFLALGGGSVTLAAALTACGGAGEATTTTVSPSAATETGQYGDGDIGILNFALTLEHLQAIVYERIIDGDFLSGSELEAIHGIGEQEVEHVKALTAAVEQAGGTPAPRPETRFKLTNAKSALRTASAVEDIVAAAYLGQVANIESPAVLASVLAIHSVEGRHALTLNKMIGGPTITPTGALARPADVSTVLSLSRPFMVV